MATQAYTAATAALLYPVRGIKLPGMSMDFQGGVGWGKKTNIFSKFLPENKCCPETNTSVCS